MRSLITKVGMGIMRMPKATYREGENRWMMYIPASLSDTGKRKPVYGSTQEEVLRNYLLKVEFKKSGNIPTLAEFTDEVLKNFVWGIKEDTTYDRYETVYRNHIQDSEIGKKPINTITDSDLSKFFKKQIDAGYAKSSVKSLHTILNKVFLRAEQRKYIEANVLKYVEIPYKRCKKAEESKQVFTLEELQKLERAVYDAWEQGHLFMYSPIFLIMAFTGMRLGEAMALKWTDINFKQHTISITKQIAEGYSRDENGDRAGKQQYEKPPKSESSNRIIPISEPVEKWIKELKRRYLSTGILCDLVVCNRNKHIPTKSNIYDTWSRLTTFAGIDYATSHKLRKTFASGAITAGVDISIVSEALGHRDVGITMAVYYKSLSKNNDELRSTMSTIYNNSHII